MYRDVIKQLKALKSGEAKPNEEWLKRNRDVLLSQIKNTVGTKSSSKLSLDRVWESMSILLPHSFVYKVLRPVTVIMLILGMGIGGWIATVAASSGSLPGEWLYPAKIATEKTQVVMANVVGDKNTETNLHVEFAKRRALETQKIISTSNPDKIQIAAETVNNLKGEIQSVNNNLQEIASTTDASAQMVKSVNQNTQQINDVLQDVKANLLVGTSTDNLSTQVTEVNNLVKDTSVKAVEVMVAKHLQGDNSVSKDEVKQVINDQLQSAMQDVVESKDNTQQAKNAVDVVQADVKLAQDVKGAVNTSSTQALSNQIDAAVKQSQDAVNQTQQISNQTDKQATEVQQLLSQDNLSLAVDKMKEATDATKQAEQVADNTIRAVQNVLPVVTVAKDDQATSTLTLVATTTLATGTLGVSTTVNLGTTTIIKAVTTTLPATSSTSTKGVSITQTTIKK